MSQRSTASARRHRAVLRYAFVLRDVQMQFLWYYSISVVAFCHKLTPALLHMPNQAGGVGLVSVLIAWKTQRVQHVLLWLTRPSQVNLPSRHVASKGLRIPGQLKCLLSQNGGYSSNPTNFRRYASAMVRSLAPPLYRIRTAQSNSTRLSW